VRTPLQFRTGAAAALVAAALGCACQRTTEPPAPLAVSLETSTGSPQTVVEITGLTRDERAALDASPPDADAWGRLLRVSVQAANPAAEPPPPVAGSYALGPKGIRFTPAFPLQPGRTYDVAVDLSAIRREGVRTLATTVGLPAGPVPAPVARVTGISPSGETLPENLLRIYVWFSAPMAGTSGLPHVRLIDERDGEIADAFLPVDGGFWNHDYTRYTLFFDPGRVKDGILRTGRPLMAGHRYRLVIAHHWRDANGAPLAEPFEHRFRAGPATTAPLDLAAWSVTAPLAGSRAPLQIRFPWPLDHALALRAIGLERSDGTAVEGEIAIDATDTEWRLTPREPWAPGRYAIVALDSLEDPAGNRVGRAFEVPIDDRPKAPAPSRFTRAVTIAPPS
jgi:hypothetical protein